MKKIPRQHWTPEMEHIALEIQYQARSTGVLCTEDDIFIFENDGTAYVLGNPVLRRHELTDELGQFTGEVVDTRNIFAEYPPGKLGWFDNGKYMMAVPRVIILRPDLCARIRGKECIMGSCQQPFEIDLRHACAQEMKEEIQGLYG